VLTLAITPGSSQSLYSQIADQVAYAIRNGQVTAGSVLPSVRAVAEQLAVNPNTVVKAYAHLEAVGLIRGFPGRGFIVEASRPVLSEAEQRRLMEETLSPVVSSAARYGWSRKDIITALGRRFDQEGLP
jgi:GntR family transcriptional regulator